MTEPIADPEHVRGELPTDPDDDTVEFQLDEAAFEIGRTLDVNSIDEALRRRLEQKLAALKILEGPDREVSDKDLGSGSMSYRGDAIARLKRELRNLDPSNGDLLEDRNQWTVTTRDVTHD